MEYGCLLVCAYGGLWLDKHELGHFVPVSHSAGKAAQPVNAFSAPLAPSALRNPFCPLSLEVTHDSLPFSHCLPNISNRCSHVPQTPQTTSLQSKHTPSTKLSPHRHLHLSEQHRRLPRSLGALTLTTWPLPSACWTLLRPPLHGLPHSFGSSCVVTQLDASTVS